MEPKDPTIQFQTNTTQKEEGEKKERHFKTLYKTRILIASVLVWIVTTYNPKKIYTNMRENRKAGKIVYCLCITHAYATETKRMQERLFCIDGLVHK